MSDKIKAAIEASRARENVLDGRYIPSLPRWEPRFRDALEVAVSFIEAEAECSDYVDSNARQKLSEVERILEGSEA